MIGVIAPYTKFKEKVEAIAKTLNIPVVTDVGGLQVGLSKAKKMIKQQNVKVIIARASTADLLAEKLDIPVVKININNFDIIKTLMNERDLNQEIILFNHISDRYRIDINSISKLMGIKIYVKYFKNEKDILKGMSNSLKDHYSVVGTAECVALNAGKRGVHSVVINTEKDSIVEALYRAKELLENIKKEEIKQKHLETIISHAFDGVISTNEKGIITVCNDVAESFLEIFPDEITNKHYKSVKIPLFQKLFGNRENVTKYIISHGNQRFVINRHHLGEESYVITFQKLEKIIEDDSQLRSKLRVRGFYAKYHFEDIIHQSKEMKEVISLAKAYAKSEGNVLIYGESGSGKELLAQSIHNESNRAKGPFVAINCAALPNNLLESELFGYVDGAFTGAKKGGKPGLFEMAHKGTIFLDEIGEISLPLQARLLRALQEKEIMRIGGDRIIPVDVRIIAATNKNLREKVAKQEFRSDLYYRLNILYIHVPPLRKRTEDLDLLIDYLVIKHNGKPDDVPKELREAFKQYDWPGNIRELENVIERIIAIKKHLNEEIPINIVKQQHILKQPSDDHDSIEIQIGTMEEMESQIVQKILHKYNGNKTKTAQKLGISRTTLLRKLG